MAITKAQEERRNEELLTKRVIAFSKDRTEKRINLRFTEKERLERNQFKILLPDPESKNRKEDRLA